MKYGIPPDKMGKKAKKAYYSAMRGTWDLNPVTRRPPNPKAYNRKKTPQKGSFPDAASFIFSSGCQSPRP